MRRLKGITMDAYEIMTDALTSRWAQCVVDFEGDNTLVDVVISDNVIIKSYDSVVNFDLGGKLASLELNEFVELSVM